MLERPLSHYWTSPLNNVFKLPFIATFKSNGIHCFSVLTDGGKVLQRILGWAVEDGLSPGQQMQRVKQPEDGVSRLVDGEDYSAPSLGQPVKVTQTSHKTS